MRAQIWCLLALCFAVDAFAAKKDFKGLFGSYRREKFTENEGKSTDFGMDIMLSTLLPITTMATSSESGSAAAGLNYMTFFNAEGSFYFTLNYHWAFYLNTGFFSYSTRKQNASAFTSDPGNGVGTTDLTNTPLFHIVDMDTIPILLGLRYRFGMSDIVPYVGAGAGLHYTRRKLYYDYSNIYDETFSTGLAAQANIGVEFFIAPRVGIRVESSAMLLMLSARSVSAGTLPVVTAGANPIAVRYAGGLFILF
jgi:hypothetical protein